MATTLHNTETAAGAVQVFPDVRQLSFTGPRPEDGGINLWSPADMGSDWIEQCRRGRSYGHEAVEFIRGTNDAAMLHGVVRAMAERGTFGGVEAGFFAAVSMSLLD